MTDVSKHLQQLWQDIWLAKPLDFLLSFIYFYLFMFLWGDGRGEGVEQKKQRNNNNSQNNNSTNIFGCLKSVMFQTNTSETAAKWGNRGRRLPIALLESQLFKWERVGDDVVTYYDSGTFALITHGRLLIVIFKKDEVASCCKKKTKKKT